MDNMISVLKDDRHFRVFFNINRERQDFENIRVRDSNNEPVLTLRAPDIEALKDIIAEEVILATMQATNAFKDGTFLAN